MNLVDELRTLAAGIATQNTFSYMSKYEHNAADHKDYTLPAINLFEIEQPGFKMNRTTGGLRNRFPIFIEFVVKSEQDLTSDQRNVLVEDMRELAAEFILAIDESDLFEELQEVINGVEIRDRYSNNVAGVEINMILVSQRPMRICS